MKSIYFLIPLLALVACKQESSIPKIEKTQPLAKTSIPSPKLKNSAASLDGFWLSDPYLTNIEKTKSIYKSRDYSTKLLGFSLYKDSLETGKGAVLGFDTHEGGYYWPLKFNETANSFNYDMSRHSKYSKPMEFSIVYAGNSILKISHTKPARQVELYRKISSTKEDVDFLDFELNRILFEGSYTDSISGKEIIFKRNGHTKGIANSTFYKLLFDFGEGLEFDTVFMWSDPSQTDQKQYHFKIDNKTIKLYVLNGDIDRMDYTINPQPIYVLKKQ